ncbi:MAG: alpha amylase [Prevotella sp.]|nr:alpha amylase [Prevotella sp.]MBQ9204642.1 alpha amylase [Prevotella sp.]
MRRIILALLTLATVAACTSIDCPVENTVYTVYKLQKPDGTTDTLGIDTLWVSALRKDGTDTLLINRLCGASATSFNLPVSYTQPEDELHLFVKDTLGTLWQDVIHVTKESSPHFESVDCKASYFHQITAVRSTHRIIDTLLINNASVNYDVSKAHFYLRLKARR